MFKLFSKKASAVDNQLYAPADGQLIDLAMVSDKVFSSKVMGEGFGTDPVNGKIVAPVSGTVVMVADTKHAIGLQMANDLEILVHMGVDTVDLHGLPFKVLVRPGDKVQGGQTIAHMNIGQIKAAGLDPVVMTVITNSADKLDALTVDQGIAVKGAVIGQVTAKEA